MGRIGQRCARGIVAWAGVVALGCGGSRLGKGPTPTGGGSGSGGAAGASGAPGAGGGMSTGGTPGAGGNPGPGAGGTMGSGGVTGAGGTTGAGGETGSGGAPATGGMTGAGGDPSCHTSLSGVVYDPSGVVPLPSVLVYVPSATPPAMTEGISCSASFCQSFPPPAFAVAVTDDSGHFTLDGVPPGSNVPLVIETGKWRRQTAVPSVAACATTALTDPELTRLPRNQSEGHLPRIAVVTGHASPMECLLRTIGIADAEFTNDAGNGRVHVYAGGAGNVTLAGTTQSSDGQAFSDAYAHLFADPARLALYDAVVLACEGSTLLTEKMPYLLNLRAYADHGGRLFLEHLQAVWISHGLPPWPSTAAWLGAPLDPPPPLLSTVDTTFPSGVLLAAWLANIGASTNGQVSINSPAHSADSPVAAGVKTWLTVPTTAPGFTPSIQQLSFATPIEADAASRCGRVDFSDMHVANGLGPSASFSPFPTGCSASPAVTAPQRMWEFMFFDNRVCVIPGGH